MNTLRIGLLALLAVIALAARAEAKHVRFLGPHPIAAKYGGGYCYIEVPHLHAYAPDHPALYHDQEGQLVFTGDPTPFGYDGQRYPFYGHHPIPGAPGVYCYLNGPHYHPYPAPEAPDYRMQKGVAFYVGQYDPIYYKEKPHRERLIQAEYRPYVSFRPTVEVAPPPEWQGEVWVAPPAVGFAAPGVTVEAPGVVVSAPGVVVAPPSVEVVAPPAPHVYLPGPPHVYVPGPPHVVVQPPRPVFVAPPAPHVYVPGPPGVVVGAPRPVIVGPGVYEVRGKHEHWEHEEHHDNGKHKGWYK
jgi:hypothetical protein